MEGEPAVAELQDWEVLASSDSDMVNSPNSTNKPRNFEEIEADSEGMIRLDYFSVDNDNRYTKTAVADISEEDGSVESDNPSWIDPGPETLYPRRNSGECWPDSGSDRSGGGKTEVGFVGNVKTDTVFEGVGKTDGKYGNFETFEAKFGDYGGKSELDLEENIERQVGIESFGEIHGVDKDLAPKFWSDSGGDGAVFDDAMKLNMESEVADELESGNCSKEENLSVVAAIEEGKLGGGGGGGGGSAEERRKLVWWKLPFEALRYCLFRVSPVWSFSIAAAVMGLVILGRRLYKMKRKPKALQLKVTMDDKKASQVMSRAARLNEAFSAVRRVPIVRPLLPASGVNPWPVMSLR